jgi:formamidopyrimidine-DNA glycosylase
MPELPEVEVLRRSLLPHLVGERILAVAVHDDRLRERVDPEALAEVACGHRVSAVERRSKYLLVVLETGSRIALHLGMSGRLTLVPAGEPREPHEHVAFALAGGRRLRLRDPRRFGAVFAVGPGPLAADRHFAGLGPEPLGPDFGGHHLARAAERRHGPVKTFLMDAAVVVGVGNIYASEACFLAGIDPRRRVDRLAAARFDRLAEATVTTLERAIAQGGTTLNDFADAQGQSGYFQVDLAAYGRAGEPCRRCGRPIAQTVLGGRSTFWCRSCQR